MNHKPNSYRFNSNFYIVAPTYSIEELTKLLSTNSPWMTKKGSIKRVKYRVSDSLQAGLLKALKPRGWAQLTPSVR